MRSKYIRSLALLLCAALLGCLLAACGGSASSPASSAAPASDSASASGSSELPSSTTEANTGELNPGNFDENSVFSITGTENAFAPCLGWGPGVSGCSLKSVIAAASLLQWAEGARMCVCSNTWSSQCRTVLTRLGIDEYFDFYIEARGAMSKSSPAPFMEALHRLGGTEPAGCAVCEDALYAAQTAHDAGFYLVGIQDTTSAADAPALRRICDQFLPDWTALDWAQA